MRFEYPLSTSIGTTVGSGAAAVAANPVVIDVGGYQSEIVALVLILISVITARLLFGFNDHEQGALRREILRLVLAALLAFGFVLSVRPGPGLAVVVGIAVGGAIVPIVDMIIALAPKILANWLPKVDK